MDYLIAGSEARELPIYNSRPIQRFQTIGGLDQDERAVVVNVLDAIFANTR